MSLRMTTMIFGALAFAALALALLPSAEATHYRYGTLSWEPAGDGTNTVIFHGAQAWRASAWGTPSVGDIVNSEGGISPGDGTYLPFSMKVVSVNPINDWMFVTFVSQDGTDGIRHTYATPNNNGAPWLASWGSCCRISERSSGNYHVNNPDQSERLETYVDLASGNRSPVTNLPPINPCVIDALCQIPIPVYDDEELTFRLATTDEAGDFSYRIPSGPAGSASVDEFGIVNWDTHGATLDPSYHTLYSIQVMIEDGQTKTPLDFFVELVPEAVSPPYWVTPPTPCGTSVTASAGAPVAFTVKAASDDAKRILYLNHLGLPPRATFPLPQPANPVESQFLWTPTLADAGTRLVIFTATDDRGYSAPPCPVTITVNRGAYDASGFGISAVAADGAIRTSPAAHVRDGEYRVVPIVQQDAASLKAAEFRFAGDASFDKRGAFTGFAQADTTVGVVEVPGVLRAEGVRLHAKSIIDKVGAESWSDLRFARLSIGGQEIEVSGGLFSGPREVRVPGVARVRIHEEIDTGDGRSNANITAYALHVIFDDPTLPVRELHLVGASANVGRDVRQSIPIEDVEARPSVARCADAAWASAPARAPSGPITILSDADVFARGGVISDLEIVVPQGGVGISVAATTMPLTIRNVHFVGAGDGAGVALFAAGPVSIVGSRFTDLADGLLDEGSLQPVVLCSQMERMRDAGVHVASGSLALNRWRVEGTRFTGSPGAVGVLFDAAPINGALLLRTNEFRGMAAAIRANGVWNTGVLEAKGNLFTGLSSGIALEAAAAGQVVVAGNIVESLAGPLVRIDLGSATTTVTLAANVIVGNAAPAMRLDGEHDLLVLDALDNVAVGNAGELVLATGELTGSVVTLQGNVIANGGGHALRLMDRATDTVLTLAANALLASDGLLDATDHRGGAISIADNVLLQSANDAIRWTGYVEETISFVVAANAIADGAAHGIDFETGFYDVDARIAGNTFTGHAAGAGLVFGQYLALSRVNVTANLFADNLEGLALTAHDYAQEGESFEVFGNVFHGNAQDGLRVTSGLAARIVRNAFVENAIGALVENCPNCPGGGGAAGPSLSLRDNDFVNNTAYGVEARGLVVPLDALGNWWGSHEGPSGAGPGTGDAVSDLVLYSPWLLTPAGPTSDATGGVPR